MWPFVGLNPTFIHEHILIKPVLQARLRKDTEIMWLDERWSIKQDEDECLLDIWLLQSGSRLGLPL